MSQGCNLNMILLAVREKQHTHKHKEKENTETCTFLNAFKKTIKVGKERKGKIMSKFQ